MNELQLNDAEFALLIAISIFSAGAEEGQEGKPARDSNQRGLQAPWGNDRGGGGPCCVPVGWERLGAAGPYFWGCDLGYGNETLARPATQLCW